MQSTGSTSAAERDLEVARRLFVRRALTAAALVAPLFLALGWWTSRSFLLRETRFNELGLEVQVPRAVPRGLALPVRFVTTDPLRMPHRAQVKWVARDAAGAELLRGAADSPGTLEVLIPADRADVASLEVRASDGAWARNATLSISRGGPPPRVELEALALPGAAHGAAVLIAQRAQPASAASEEAEESECTWIAFDGAGVPLARTPARWRGPFALALWRPRSADERAQRFELRGPREEIRARLELERSGDGAPGARRAECRAELTEDGAALRLSIALRDVPTAELRWWDAEREHARRRLTGSGPHELELTWSAPRAGASFVSLQGESGEALVLLELPAPAPLPIEMSLRELPGTGELEIELSATRGTRRERTHALVFDAASRIASAASAPTAVPRELDPRSLAYFGGDAEALGSLGYGAFQVAHSSDALRAEQLARREADELLARRIVFATAIALAAWCAAAWLLAIARRGSFAVPPAWRFASGAAVLSLAFALVAARFWWGSPTLASPPPAPGPALPASSIETLRAIEPAELAVLGAPIALITRNADEGPLRFPAANFAGRTRVAVRVIDADGALHRRELELPQR
jgi:hypothetical protein